MPAPQGRAGRWGHRAPPGTYRLPLAAPRPGGPLHHDGVTLGEIWGEQGGDTAPLCPTTTPPQPRGLTLSPLGPMAPTSPCGDGAARCHEDGRGQHLPGGFPPPPGSPDPLPCPHAPLGPPASPVGQRRGFFFSGGRDTQPGGQRAVGTYRRPAVACQPRAPVFTLRGGEKGCEGRGVGWGHPVWGLGVGRGGRGGAYPRSGVAALPSGSWQPGPGVTLCGGDKISSLWPLLGCVPPPHAQGTSRDPPVLPQKPGTGQVPTCHHPERAQHHPRSSMGHPPNLTLSPFWPEAPGVP